MLAVFHPGEIEVQERAGVREDAARTGHIIGNRIPPRAQEFLLDQPLAFLGAADSNGRAWTSILSGLPGFLRALDDQAVRIDAVLPLGDPLASALAAERPVGLLVMDFAARRRMRLNGLAARQPDGALQVRIREVFANCPRYIQPRQWHLDSQQDGSAQDFRSSAAPRRVPALSPAALRSIERADTFFISSVHSKAGADVSHRGGQPGFVRVRDGRKLIWPDYSGNNMFQTLGNLARDPRAGLLFLDFDCGATLQLTGRAQVVWDPVRVAEFPAAKRLVEFEIEQAIESPAATPLRWTRLGDP